MLPLVADDARPAKRVRLRPHVESHGLYSMEWSYHFPLSPGYRVESQLDLDFPSEKVPGAARTSLRDANISTTRLSFADTAATVRGQSLKFLKDTLWLLYAAKSEAGEAFGPRITDARKSFLHVAREYWTTTFFARLGVILQSDLKACRNSLREIIRARASTAGAHEDILATAQLKGEVLASFRAAARLVRARLVWEELLTIESAALAQGADPSELQLSLRFVQQVRDLSELALAVVSTAVAELQQAVSEVLKTTVEQIAMVRGSQLEAPELGEEFGARLLSLQATCLGERRWLAEWARHCNDLRLLCGLPSLVDLAADPSLAASHYERVRTLKKQYYHVWDLDLDLKPNDTRFDFWIGAGAAGISALFAFGALLAFGIHRAPFEQQGAFALVAFALANAGIYVAKDRLKEWLKVNLRTVLSLRLGRWTGECTLRSEGAPEGSEALKVALMERETWWTEKDENWSFHVWEEFRITPDAASADARIAKQVWRLPLDEILHTLDSTRHVLKIPSADGEAREVPVLKHTEFPFRLRVRVRRWEAKRMEVVDRAYVVGRVRTAGDHIFSVEISDESDRIGDGIGDLGDDANAR